VKRSLWLLSTLILLAVAAVSVSPQAISSHTIPQEVLISDKAEKVAALDFVPGEVIFATKSHRDSIEKLCNQYNLELEPQSPEVLIHSSVRRELPYVAKTFSDLDEVIEKLNLDPRVEYAEKNILFPVPPDSERVEIRRPLSRISPFSTTSLRSQQWGLESMEVPDGIQSNTLVAIIDTGVSPFTPELAANVVGGYDFVNETPDFSDGGNHGTHVAGTIAGRYGVGTIKVLAQKALVKDSQGRSHIELSAAIEAVYDAVAKGAKVINATWGGSLETPKSMRRAIQYAGDHDVLFIAAAGNASSDNDVRPFFPASSGEWNVIAVAGTANHRFFMPERLDPDSSYGRHSVHLTAPFGIFSEESTESSFVSRFGTSYSAPFISAEAAIAFDIYQNARAVKEAILTTVDTLDLLRDKVASAGRANFRRMIRGERNPEPQISIASQFQGVRKTPLNISITLSNPSGGAFQFQWEFGDGKTEETDVPEVTHTYKKKKSYQVVCTATYFTGRTFVLNTTATIAKK